MRDRCYHETGERTRFGGAPPWRLKGLSPSLCIPPRLRNIREAVSEGRTNREIADGMFLAEHTVRNYVSELMRECDVTNRVQLAIRIRERLTFQSGKGDGH